ncbi:hypothetical protein [Streptomyces sp. NPDC046821]
MMPPEPDPDYADASLRDVDQPSESALRRLLAPRHSDRLPL